MRRSRTRPTHVSSAATRPTDRPEHPGSDLRLYLVFELGKQQWELGFTTGFGQPPRERTIAAGDLLGLRSEIAQARRRFALSDDAPVCSCYEAGREGFWLHRALTHLAIVNVVVDSASIEVNRRMRRAKSDHLDARKLLTMLLRYYAGERRVWSVVQIPTPEEEDRRQVHRELACTKRDRARITNRIKGLLASQGVRLVQLSDFPAQLPTVRTWDGAPLLPGLRARLEREWAKVADADGTEPRVGSDAASLVADRHD